LTIEDGTQVIFELGTSLTVGDSDGRVLVNGTSTGVLFTSAEDTPAPGDWNGFAVRDLDQGSVIEGLTLEYAGGNGSYAVELEGSATWNNSIVRRSSQDGLRIDGTALPSIKGSSFVDNFGRGVVITSNAGLAEEPTPSFANNNMAGNGGVPVVMPADELRHVAISNTFTGNGDDRIELTTDSIQLNATWSQLGVPYRVKGNVTVAGVAAPVLTLAAGTVFQFDSVAQLRAGTSALGSIVANGTATSRVQFTSSAAVPTDGDWPGILIGASGSASDLHDFTLEYGGAGGGGLLIDGSSPTIANGIIRLNGGDGIAVTGGGALPWIHDTEISDNGAFGVSVTGGAGLDVANEPSFTSNTLTGNVLQPIEIGANSVGQLDSSTVFTGNGVDEIRITGGTVTRTQTWQLLDVRYVAYGEVTVAGPAAPRVTVRDEVVIEWDCSCSFSVGTGNLGSVTTQGTTVGVRFTSASVAPAAADWNGIVIGSQDMGSQLEGLTLEYAGLSGAALKIDGSAPTIDGCTIDTNAGDGIQVTGSGTPEIFDTTISNSLADGVDIGAAGGLSGTPPSFSGNTITGNAGVAMLIPGNYLGHLATSSAFTGNGTDEVHVRGDVMDRTQRVRKLDVRYRVIGDLSIESGGLPVVTVERGTTMAFDSSVGITVGSGEAGRLIASGALAGSCSVTTAQSCESDANCPLSETCVPAGSCSVSTTTACFDSRDCPVSETCVGSDPIHFTSAQTIPAPGDWDGITFRDQDTGSQLSNVIIDYAGANGAGNLLYVDVGDTAGITDTLVTHSANWGMTFDVTGSCTTSASTNCFNDSGCPNMGTCTLPPEPVITNVTYANNTDGTFRRI
jgi:hypothetical protein